MHLSYIEKHAFIVLQKGARLRSRPKFYKNVKTPKMSFTGIIRPISIPFADGYLEGLIRGLEYI